MFIGKPETTGLKSNKCVSWKFLLMVVAQQKF